jgi:hypothetical protein
MDSWLNWNVLLVVVVFLLIGVYDMLSTMLKQLNIMDQTSG